MAVVNTIVDGHDVLKVLIWEHPGSDKGNLVTSLMKDTKVIVTDRNGDYVKVSVTNEKETLSGWCLKDFVHETNG